MKRSVSKLPLPLSGLGLAFAAIGNLIASINPQIQAVFCSVAIIILLLIAIKVIVFIDVVRKEIENPVIMSVLPTYSMAMMSLSGFIRIFSAEWGFLVWAGGVILHIFLMGFYTFYLFKDFSINKIFPSSFIPYVGIAVASVQSQMVGQMALGRVMFWFGLATFILLLPVILYRSLIIKNIPEPALPVTAVFAAPSSLLVCAYFNLYAQQPTLLTNFLAITGIILTACVLLYMFIKLLKLPFYPSYSAFGFPLVISALAMKKISLVYGLNENLKFVFTWMYYIESAIAIGIVLYVFLRYVIFLSELITRTFKDEKSKKTEVST